MTSSTGRSPEDQRRYRRKACRISAGCAYLDHHYETVLRNVSAGGAMADRPGGLGVGARLTMTIFFRKTDHPTIVIGEVVWVSDDQMGVRFHAGFDGALVDTL